jgi:hypothetical protein
VCEAVSKLNPVFVYHVCKDECWGSTSSLHRLDQQLSTAVKGFLNETVSRSEVLFGVFCLFILYLKVVVLKVFVSRSVGLASNIEDVGDAQVDQLLCFECRLEGPHEESGVNLEEINLSNCLRAKNVT